MNRSTNTRESIQEAAKRLFAEKGYNATSTRDIVNEAGVNISAIAYHFGGKEGLFLSLFDDFLHQGSENSDAIIEPVTELKILLARIIGLRFEDPELVTILQQEIVVHSPRTDVIKERLIPVWRRIRLLLKQGRDEGHFQFRNVDNALNFVMSTVVFPRQNPFFQDLVDRTETEEKVIDEMIGFVVKGLGCTNEI